GAVLPVFVLVLEDGGRSKALREGVCDSLPVFGRDAAEAVPALVRAALSNQPTAPAEFAVRRTLATLGADAVPPVVKMLVTPGLDARGRTFLLSVLGETKDRPKTTVPALVGALKTARDPAVRRTALEALAVLGVEAKDAAPLALELLRDPEMRVEAAHALARFGAEGKAAVPVLVEQLAADNRDVRKAAVLSLGALGPAAKEAVPPPPTA